MNIFTNSKRFVDRLKILTLHWLRSIPAVIGAIFYLGIPLAIFSWIVYRLISPLFSQDSADAYFKIVENAGLFGLMIGCQLAVIYGAIKLWEFAHGNQIVLKALKSLIAIFLVTLAVSATIRMFDGNASPCVGFARHSNC